MKHGQHSFPTFIIVSMAVHGIGIAIVAIIAIAYIVKALRSRPDSSEDEETQPSSSQMPYSCNNRKNNHNHLKFKHHVETQPLSPQARCSNHNSNNHDDRKKMHSTRASAEAEVRRMTMSGDYDECERLNVYHNDEFGGWFVGRGWRR